MFLMEREPKEGWKNCTNPNCHEMHRCLEREQAYLQEVGGRLSSLQYTRSTIDEYAVGCGESAELKAELDQRIKSLDGATPSEVFIG